MAQAHLCKGQPGVIGRLTRRAALFSTGALAGGWVASRLTARLPGTDGVTLIRPPASPNTLNDAGGLSETPVFRHVILSQDPGDALVAAIRAEMGEARREGRPVNIGAARHSIGGQAIPRDGHAITFDNDRIETDSAARTISTHAGARWSRIIATLDPLGLSPRVMQSNNDFGIAATFCVNAHGWPVREGPMGATVRAIEMVLPSGDLVTCSRDKNPDIFAMTMGGYGLTGAITRIEADTVPNLRLDPVFDLMPAADFAARFAGAVDDGAVNMAYGRLNVDRDSFFRHALMVTYRPATDQSDLPAASGSGLMAHAASRLYRWQPGREDIKGLRWWAETRAAPALGNGPVTRNSLLNEPAVTLDDRNPDRTDILHEYFVAPERFAEFLELCRQVIPGSYQEFLNVTLRFVDTDSTSWLSYATVPRIAAVMSFTQEMSARAEADMTRLTQELIEGVTAIGGSYYLPYRPHARLDQFAAAYPRAGAFAAAKQSLDPGLIFRNNLWDRYLGKL